MPLVLAVLLVAIGAARAEGLPDALDRGGAAVVTDIVDGDTLFLDREIDGAREVRLVGIQAPKLPLGRPGFREWPLAKEAATALERLVKGRSVTLGFGGRRMDRHGRLLAHLYRDDGVWVQGELIAAGMARVYSFADNRALVPEMLAIERAARAIEAGLWSHPFYAVLTPETAGRHIDTFALVEGAVLDAAVVRGRVYLNFGTNWRDDFTVTLPPAVVRLFTREGLAPETYEGRRIRVRGWLESYNGPMIEATHPEQIELIEE